MHIEIVCCIKEQQKTKGKGIIIHKKHCPAMRKLKQS